MRKPVVEEIALKDLRIDGGTQPRAKMDDATVDEYAEWLKDHKGEELPPAGAVKDKDGVRWLYDGFHRRAAYEKAGRKRMPVEVRDGEHRDAVLLSVAANATHGLKRTNKDKRRAVETMMRDAEWSKWSNNQIAKHCSVGADLVADVRKSLTIGNDSENRRTYQTKHGTTAEMKTGNIGGRKNGDDAYRVLGPDAPMTEEEMQALRAQAAEIGIAEEPAPTVPLPDSPAAPENLRLPGDDTEAEAAEREENRRRRAAAGKPVFNDREIETTVSSFVRPLAEFKKLLERRGQAFSAPGHQRAMRDCLEKWARADEACNALIESWRQWQRLS